MSRINNMNETNNKLSTEQLNKMSVEEILAFNGFKKVNNELVRLEETKGNVLSLSPCTQLVLNTPAAFTAGTPVGPSTSINGAPATSLIYTVLVTNTGGTEGSTVVTLYEGVAGTIISQPGTGTISPGGTQTMEYTLNASSWIPGTYQICSRIGP